MSLRQVRVAARNLVRSQISGQVDVATMLGELADAYAQEWAHATQDAIAEAIQNLLDFDGPEMPPMAVDGYRGPMGAEWSPAMTEQLRRLYHLKRLDCLRSRRAYETDLPVTPEMEAML